MNPKTLQEKVEYISFLHKQNLNGRESEDELFELGIQAGIEETEEDRDEFTIGFVEWFTNEKSTYSIMYGNQEKRFSTFKKDYTVKELLEIYKKYKSL